MPEPSEGKEQLAEYVAEIACVTMRSGKASRRSASVTSKAMYFGISFYGMTVEAWLTRVHSCCKAKYPLLLRRDWCSGTEFVYSCQKGNL